MRRIPNSALAAAGAIAAAAILAGCGGGGGGHTMPATTTSTSGSGSSASPGAMFSVASVSGVGKVVVDGKGRTVYILTSSSQKNVPCNDSSGCTGVWPDLPLPSGTTSAKAGMGIKSSLLGTKKIGSETYPTYNGWLMYEYTGDSGSGQANGQGIKSFGGTWYVLNASGNPVKSSSGGSGYP